MFAEAPILGHGFRSFPQLWARCGPTHLPKAAHSTHVEIACEAGLLGIVGYLACVGALGLGGWRLTRRRDDPFFSDLGVGFVAAVLCLLILDISGTRFREGEVMAFMWVIGGVVTRLAIPTPDGATRLMRPRPVPRPARTDAQRPGGPAPSR
jgi:O-antigen ligase